MNVFEITLLFLAVGISGGNFVMLWRVVFNHLQHLRKLIEEHLKWHMDNKG